MSRSRLPLAAGFEPLNPNIATAPAEAQPSTAPTLAPTWVSFGDDRVFYAYDSLPKGNYRFAFRVRAQTAGAFTQPPALVEAMYKKGLRATSAGAARGDREMSAAHLRLLRIVAPSCASNGSFASRADSHSALFALSAIMLRWSPCARLRRVALA